MPHRRILPVCNLYSVHTTQEAMRRAFEVSLDSAGNVPPLPAIFPDQMAPVVRTRDGERELIQMRWGFPAPPKVGNHPVTNVRNVSSPFWRAWLKPQYRCLVPLTSFSEYKDTKPRKTPVWFSLNKDWPLAAFAGIWLACGKYQRTLLGSRPRRRASLNVSSVIAAGLNHGGLLTR